MNPRRLVEDCLTEEVPDGLIVSRPGHRFDALSAASAALWHACDGERTPESLTEFLPPSIPERDRLPAVHLALRRLRRCGLIDWAPTVNRRDLGRTVSRSIAASLLVISAVAPTPGETGSLGGPGSTCQDSSQCQSGLCIGGTCA